MSTTFNLEDNNVSYQFVFNEDVLEIGRKENNWACFLCYYFYEISFEKLNSQCFYKKDGSRHKFFTEYSKTYLLKLIKNRAFI